VSFALVAVDDDEPPLPLSVLVELGAIVVRLGRPRFVNATVELGSLSDDG